MPHGLLYGNDIEKLSLGNLVSNCANHWVAVPYLVYVPRWVAVSQL